VQGFLCLKQINVNPNTSIVTGLEKARLLLEEFLCLSRAMIIRLSFRRIMKLVDFEAKPSLVRIAPENACFEDLAHFAVLKDYWDALFIIHWIQLRHAQ
jgi:hypothetical protein